MDTGEIGQKLMEQVLGSGLLTLEDIAAIGSGDMSPVRKLLPLLLKDDDFKTLVAEQSDPASANGATRPERVGRTDRAAEVPSPPTGPQFPGVADEFATRLGKLLAHRDLNRQIQINMQINPRGVTFQVVRFVRTPDGVEAEPYLAPVQTPHGQLGGWLVQALQESKLRLLAEAEDAQLLDMDDGSEEVEGAEDEGVEETPRRRAPPTTQRQQLRR